MAEKHNGYSGLAAFILDGNTEELHQLFGKGVNNTVVAIYRNGYYRACREVLESTFPTLLLELGRDAFSSVAHQFTRHSPPRHGTLTGYGEHFVAWLDEQLAKSSVLDPHANTKLPWLADLARLDWAWLQCLHGFDTKPLSATEVQKLVVEDCSKLHIGPLANAQILVLNYGVFERWLMLRRGELMNTNNPTQMVQERVMFWRPDMTVRITPLSEEEYRILCWLSRAQESDVNLADIFSITDIDIASIFEQWIGNGVLQKLE